MARTPRPGGAPVTVSPSESCRARSCEAGGGSPCPPRAAGSAAGAGVPGLSRAPKGESAGGASQGEGAVGEKSSGREKGARGRGVQLEGCWARPLGAMLELHGPAVLEDFAEAILRGGG